jgi:hypothetical protein
VNKGKKEGWDCYTYLDRSITGATLITMCGGSRGQQVPGLRGCRCGHRSAQHETRPTVGAQTPVPTIWAPMGRGQPVAQPTTRGFGTSVAGFVSGKGIRYDRGERVVAYRPTAKDAYQEGKLALPPGYGLEHGADVLLLRRADGSVAAVFSATGAAQAEMVRTAEEDHKRNSERPVWGAPSEDEQTRAGGETEASRLTSENSPSTHSSGG